MESTRKAIVAVTRDEHQIHIKVNGDPRPAIQLAFANCSDAVKREAMGYGLEVRLTRRAALDANQKTGKSATPAQKYDAIKLLADHYAAGGDWRMAAAGGGGGLSADTRALIEALVRALGLSEDVAEEQVREMTTSERDALRGDEEIKPVLDAIYAERAKAAGADAKGLLAKLRAKG